MPGEPAGYDMAPGSLFARYVHILQEGGLSAAARVVYLGFCVRIAKDLHIRQYTALTPRELSQSCTKKPYCGPFSSFVLVYERVRYGGYRSAAVQTEFEAEMKNTDTQLEVKIIKAAYWIVGIVLLMAALILATHLTSNNLDFSQYNPELEWHVAVLFRPGPPPYGDDSGQRTARFLPE